MKNKKVTWRYLELIKTHAKQYAREEERFRLLKNSDKEYKQYKLLRERSEKEIEILDKLYFWYCECDQNFRIMVQTAFWTMLEQATALYETGFKRFSNIDSMIGDLNNLKDFLEELQDEITFEDIDGVIDRSKQQIILRTPDSQKILELFGDLFHSWLTFTNSECLSTMDQIISDVEMNWDDEFDQDEEE